MSRVVLSAGFKITSTVSLTLVPGSPGPVTIPPSTTVPTGKTVLNVLKPPPGAGSSISLKVNVSTTTFPFINVNVSEMSVGKAMVGAAGADPKGHDQNYG